MAAKNVEHGASMVEISLLLVIVFSITLAVIDFARVLMFEAVLNKGAEEGLNVALTISNYDIDVRELNLDDSRFYDFYEKRAVAFSKPQRGCRWRHFLATQTLRARHSFTCSTRRTNNSVRRRLPGLCRQRVFQSSLVLRR